MKTGGYTDSYFGFEFEDPDDLSGEPHEEENDSDRADSLLWGPGLSVTFPAVYGSPGGCERRPGR